MGSSRTLRRPTQLTAGASFRGNDGAVDVRGRFFVGTMNDPLVKSPEPEGQ